jgi:apolipoprotein N-acyltransferase
VSETAARWGTLVAAPALVSALGLSLAFPPFEQSWIAWVALAPLFAALVRARGPEARALGFVFGLVLAAWNLRWLAAVFGAAGAAFWILFAAFSAIVCGIVAAARDRWGAGTALALLPAIWIAIEHFRSEVWPLRFGWITPGYALAASDTWIQAADVAGVYGLTLAVVGANALFAAASVSRRPAGIAIAAAAIPAILATYGVARRTAPLEAPTLRVGLLQFESQSLDDACALAMELPPVSLIVAPEIGAALHEGRAMHLDDPEPAAILSALARARGAVVVIGGTRDAPGGSPLTGFYNSLAIVDADGTTTYTTKAEPVPLFADGARADRPRPVETSLGTIGTAICYDATHPHVIEALAPEARLLVVASGDLASWGALQHAQHARMARVRAVEHRRWMVRATSSGLTQIVDPRGDVHAELGFGEVGSISGSVALRDETTLRDWVGPWVPRAAYAIAGLAIVLLVARRRGG